MKAASADNELKIFLDTSILIAAFYGDHQHHAASLELFLGCDKRAACCGAHSLAEFYSALTRMPGKRRVAGDDAVLFLADIRDRLSVVSLDERESHLCISAAAEAGLTGGAIYDALLGQCALKADVEGLYSWNSRDFLRLPGPIASRVKEPQP